MSCLSLTVVPSLIVMFSPTISRSSRPTISAQCRPARSRFTRTCSRPQLRMGAIPISLLGLSRWVSPSASASLIPTPRPAHTADDAPSHIQAISHLHLHLFLRLRPLSRLPLPLQRHLRPLRVRHVPQRPSQGKGLSRLLWWYHDEKALPLKARIRRLHQRQHDHPRHSHTEPFPALCRHLHDPSIS